jgi:hypothetical protein
MKRILFLLALVGCLLSQTSRAQAATEVSVNFFYDNLSPYGNWIEVGDYGYCFQPNVAVNNPSWRPYADGYWAYTDVGWTWVSYEDFGWATYHYGRWTDLADYGWVWVPGYEWGPAWVSWRTGGDYIGWAPLPPTREYVYEGRPITGHVDVEFDIGPLFYNFVDIRYVGEPVLRERLIAPQQNVTIINRTVNVTNITYINSTVYNYGPDLNRVNQFSTRPVQRLSIQRETNVAANVQGGHGNLNRVNGNQFVVTAPPIKKSEQKVAPKEVKAKVQQAKVEHGWQGVSNRDQIQTAMKNENPKNVPAPSFQPQKGEKSNANASANGGDSAQPNEPNRAVENGAAPGHQQGDRAARQAESNNRGQSAEQITEATQADSTNRQAQRAQRPGQRRPGEQQPRPSGNQDQDQPNAANSQQAEQTYNRPAHSPRAKQNQYQPEPGQPTEGQGQDARRQGGQAKPADQSARDDQSQNDQSQHARPPRPEPSQPQNQRANQNRSGGDVEQGAQRDHSQQQAQRPPQRERAPQARPHPQQSQPQVQDDQNGERKGKKKKPDEAEPTP